MREASLPSPGTGNNGYHLRRVAAKAISDIQKVAPKYAGGVHPNASTLRAFFSACADSLAPVDATPADENA